MRVAKVTAFHVRIPLRKTIRHASHVRRFSDNVVVRCRLDDGSEGWGEGVPRPYVTGETIDSAFEQLRSTDLQQQLGGPFDGLRGAIELCDSFRLTTPQTAHRDCFGNAVRCAVELSVLDAAARAEQTPLSAVTRLVPETVAIRQSRQMVHYSAAITAMSPVKQFLLALTIRSYSFRQVKVKVGVTGIDDAALLQRVRRAVGTRLDLRIDANEAWTCENLEENLEPLTPFGITSLEQPVPHEAVAGLAAVRSRISIPIMLDESLCSMGDARRAIESGTCDLFNIRLSKCGGLINSLRLAATAHTAGLGYQLGCQVGETGILSAAGRHFATSVAGIRYLEGSYDGHLVRERLTVEDLTFRRGGRAPELTAPGLGVQINAKALAEVTVREEHWRLA